MRVVYFYLLCITSSISHSVLLFHVFQFLHLFFFFWCFLMSLSSIVEKLLYTYVNYMYNIYILENMTFCPTKKFMTFWFHLFDLMWIGCKISNLKIISKITYGVCITESQKKLYFLKFSESPLDCKEIQPVHSEGDQHWDFFGRNDAKAETSVLWPPHAKSWLIGKDTDAGRDWGQENKGMTEDEMAGWHHWLDGRESEWTPGVGDGQGGLACCD